MSGIPDDRTEGRNTERLNEMAFAFKNSQAMVASIELGLFDAIEAGAGTNAEIAAATGLPEETAIIYVGQEYASDGRPVTPTWEPWTGAPRAGAD